MDMRIPLKAAAESMKNTNKAVSETLRFIEFAEYTKNNVTDRMEKAVE